MALGGLVLGSLILYLKGMRIMMFQLSSTVGVRKLLVWSFRVLRGLEMKKQG